MQKNHKPLVVIPKVTKANPNAGLLRTDGIWKIRWKEDGKSKVQSTGTLALTTARKIRDAHFDKLVRAGARVGASRTAAEKAAANPNLYIFRQKPFVVRINRKEIGRGDTIEEAIAIRDRHLGIVPRKAKR